MLIRWVKGRRLIARTVIFGLLVEAAPAQLVLYVDVDSTAPSPNGLTWCTAYSDLSTALNLSYDGIEIRVARGTYFPDPTGLPHPREASLRIPPGVKIAGAYAGCGEPDPNARDAVLFETVLSGDLDRNDYTGGDTSDNSYHVVWASNSGVVTFFPSVIDGFRITAGRADGMGFPSGHSAGGGLYTSGDVTVTGCTIVRNEAVVGGGMFNLEGSPFITDCVFEDNRAQWAGGLALYGFPAAGGLDHPPPRFNVAHGDPRLARCRFVNNQASHSGGALWVHGFQENPTFSDCVFASNTAGVDGGAFFMQGTIHQFSNTLFSGNRAGAKGGAGLVLSDTVLKNCTMADNSAAAGGGVFIELAGRTSFVDSVFWGNRAGGDVTESAQIDGQPPGVDHCCVQGWTGVLGGRGNGGGDPLFVPGPAGCYYLSQPGAGQSAMSPCVDAGSVPAALAGLGTFVTRVDEVADAGTVDLGYHYSMRGLSFVWGDADLDGRVSLEDFGRQQACFTGPTGSPVPPCCRVFDFQADGLVDRFDYARWAAHLLGP